jgi:protein-disulfide isomerase
MKKVTKLAVLLALSAVCVAQSAQPATSALPTEATVDGFLKQMFGWDQNLTWKVVEVKAAQAPGFAEVTAIFNTPQGQQPFRLYVTPDQKFALYGELIPFGADPFAADRATLKAVNGPTHGPADASITIVEFGDLECPACKAAQAPLTKLIEEEPKAKLIYQNFPLESVHKWALLGAKYLTCIGQQSNDTAFKFISTVYDHQGEVTPDTADAMLKGYAKTAGANVDSLSSCIAKPETDAKIRESIKLGEKLGVNSTPTFFINGRKIVGFGANTRYEDVKAMVDYYMGSAK